MSMKAIISQAPGEASFVSDAAKPVLRDDYILVKTAAVALNPTDWKHIDFRACKGAIVGCDYSGVVEEVGKDVNKRLKKGDRVAGFTHGVNHSNLDDGAFAEYIVAKGDLQLHIPDSLSFESAATLGLGIITAAQALYQSLELPLPDTPVTTKNLPVLVYGGSTATGTLAIQFAKMSGAKVITTCSPRNFELVKTLGAEAAFDYNDPECGQRIRDYTNNALTHVLDCISLDPSVSICTSALSTSSPSIYACILPITLPATVSPDLVQVRPSVAFTALGENFRLGTGPEFHASATDFQFAVKVFEVSERLLREGKLEVHPPSVRPGGLHAVLGGLQEMRAGRVSGEKLVYRVS